MTKQLAIVPSDLDSTIRLSGLLAASGYFSDAKGEAQAVVKVLAGAEMGFGPIASMTGVHVIQGKPSIGANLIAAAVKASPRYDYRVKENTPETCEIEFFQNGDSLGVSTFTMADAKAAGLTSKDNWRKFPRNMLFSRAMSNGVRWFCPDVMSGVTVYTPEELDPDLHLNDGGDVIDVVPTKSAATPTSQQQQTELDEAFGPRSDDNPPDPRLITERTDKLFILVNEQLPEGWKYAHTQHMLNTARKLAEDKSWMWPHQDDDEMWDQLEVDLVGYALKKKAEKEAAS